MNQPATAHRENIPPFDLAPIERRISERRAYTSSRLVQSRDAIDADTDMMQMLLLEVKKLRLSTDSLRSVLAKMGPA